MVGTVPARAWDAAVGLVAVSEEQAASTIVLASASRERDDRVTWSALVWQRRPVLAGGLNSRLERTAGPEGRKSATLRRLAKPPAAGRFAACPLKN